MDEAHWTAEQVVEFEEWFLDDMTTSGEAAVRGLQDVPAASRDVVRDRILAELSWRKQALHPRAPQQLRRDDALKIQELETKERGLLEEGLR